MFINFTLSGNCVWSYFQEARHTSESRPHDFFRTYTFPSRCDTNWAVQPQKMARGLKFLIKEVEGLYYL